MALRVKLTKPENSNKKRKLKKKSLIFISALVLIVAISITYALFFSTISIANTFETMKYNVTFEEEFYNDWGTKRIYLENNEKSTPVVIRVSYIELWSQENGDDLKTLSNKVNGEDVVTKEWTSTWTTYFVDGGDGWYYYTKVLGSGDRIQLLESIEFNETVGTSLRAEYDYELTFNYEAIQASEKAVEGLWGKKITINGDNITW